MQPTNDCDDNYCEPRHAATTPGGDGASRESARESIRGIAAPLRLLAGRLVLGAGRIAS